MLRWHIQYGLSAIPKSVRSARIAENIDLFDFTLTTDDTAAIDAFDTGGAAGLLERVYQEVDEISLIILPAVDGAQGAPSVFDFSREDTGSLAPVRSITLENHQVLEGGAVSGRVPEQSLKTGVTAREKARPGCRQRLPVASLLWAGRIAV